MEGTDSLATSALIKQAQSDKSKDALPKYTRDRPRFVKTWWPELLAATLSISSVASMVALLGTIDHKPYEQWRIANFNITPNALLSILATISKSSLLLAVAEALGQLKWVYFQQRAHQLFDLQIFDEATRGPLGALRFLWKIHIGAFVGSIGASLVVLAIAIDPFAQQILTYQSEVTDSRNETAHISATNVYGSPFADSYSSYNIEMPVYDREINQAVLSGLLSSDNPTNFTCPTGNCVWPTYTSLGVCNKCRDLSDQLKVSCEPSDKPFGDVIYCTYTFPPTAPDTPPFTTNVTWWYEVVGAMATIHINNSLTDTALGTLLQIESLQLPPYTRMYGKWTWPMAMKKITPRAYQCNMTWCEQTYAASRCENGILKDAPTGRQDLNLSEIPQVDGKMPGGFNKQTNMLCPAWPYGEPQPSAAQLNISHYQESNNVYWIGGGMIYEFLRTTFQTDMQNMTNFFADSLITPSSLQYQLYYTNLPQALDNVAASITNKARQLNTTERVLGTVKIPVTYVYVNWYWFAYPAALVSLAAAFLVVSIIFSNERGGIVWKSSTLPLLTLRLDGRAQQTDGSSLSALEREARKIQVQLSEGNEDITRLYCISSDVAENT